MKRLCLAVLIAGVSLQAHAVGRLADVTVVDRDTGQTLQLYSRRGEYWVAGRPGARYSIRIRNQVGERLLAVPSVDGVNILTGDTAGWGQSGSVYAAWQSYELTGWRKSDTEVAAFEFTAEPNSYASRTGRPANVGVIGVAVFRERRPLPLYRSPLREERAAADAANEGELSRSDSAEPSAAPAPSERFSDKATAKLGTGHGAREESVVEQTSFERLQERPNEVIRIRYDSRANLVAMGVIRLPRDSYPPRPSPDPFPDSAVASYVPDPARAH